MNKWGIKAKFSAAVGVFALTLCVVIGLSIQSMSKISSSTERLIKEDVQRRIIALQLVSQSNEAGFRARDLVAATTDTQREAIDKKLSGVLTGIEQKFGELQKLQNERLKASIEKSLEPYQLWKKVVSDLRNLANTGKKEEAFKFVTSDLVPSRAEVENKLNDVVQNIEKDMENAITENEKLAARMRNVILLFSGFGLLVGVVSSGLIIRATIRAINQTTDTLSETSNQVASAAQQIANSSQSLSEAATEQAASLEETSSAVEETNSMVQRNLESAKESTLIAQQSVVATGRGQEVVVKLMGSMDEINKANLAVMTQTNESNQEIQAIVNVINEIGNKTKVINEIVFQPKLLSFNASVEAARAGEHGKGFAVVAEEVGNLAQMSGNAAKDITSLLEGSIQKVQNIVNNSKTRMEMIVNDNATKVADGTRIAQECSNVLNQIAVDIQNVSRMNQSVAGASVEQARGITEISRAITQLDQVTQVNAASSEEAASASEELLAQAEQMKRAVNSLCIVVRGGSDSESSIAPAWNPSDAPRNQVNTRSNVVPLKRNTKFKNESSPKVKLVSGGETFAVLDEEELK